MNRTIAHVYCIYFDRKSTTVQRRSSIVRNTLCEHYVHHFESDTFCSTVGQTTKNLGGITKSLAPPRLCTSCARSWCCAAVLRKVLCTAVLVSDAQSLCHHCEKSCADVQRKVLCESCTFLFYDWSSRQHSNSFH